jgi:undecaprenyl-diphosphatase
MSLDLPPRIKARLDPAERYGLRVTLVAIAVVLVAVPFSILTVEVLAKGPLTRLDGRVANTLNGWVQNKPAAEPTLQAISWLGRPPLLALWVVIAIVLLWRNDRRRVAVFLVVTSLGGGIVDTLVKAAVNRPRPVVDHPIATAFGKSFPSGHAMSSTVTYGALLVAAWPFLSARLRRVAAPFAVLLVLAIGSSRLLLGVHFVSDVIGGYVLGLAWLAGSVAVFQTWRVEEHRADVAEERHDQLVGATGRPDPKSAIPSVGLDRLREQQDRDRTG